MFITFARNGGVYRFDNYDDSITRDDSLTPTHYVFYDCKNNSHHFGIKYGADIIAYSIFNNLNDGETYKSMYGWPCCGAYKSKNIISRNGRNMVIIGDGSEVPVY